ncbi:MAG: folate-binding protein [Gammaproteobacteria bacterium]|nr:MAG: folate-binding protein [Gammaproteobacteria bacterium]
MPTSRYCDLPDLGVVSVTGADARSFLQGQLTNDLRMLDDHPGLLAAACNPQGRVLAILRLAAIDDGVLLLLGRALIPALLAHLAKYVLRARVQLEDRSDEFSIAGLLETGSPGAWSNEVPTGVCPGILVASSRRLLLAGPAATVTSTLADLPETTRADWLRASIEDGEPELEPDTAGLWIPQMLNLDLLAAVSFAKGCYTGQEVIARTQHLGRIKRRMLRYSGPPDAGVTPGQTLYSGDALAGQVVRACMDAGTVQLLAVVGLEYRADLLGRSPGGTEFVPAELPYL